MARPDVLGELLSTTDRIVQEIDSVEYGLTDIQEYYANTGMGPEHCSRDPLTQAPDGVHLGHAFQEL